MSKSVKFQQYARECAALAERTTTGSHRAMMLSMAGTWLKFAHEEGREPDWKAEELGARG